MARSKRYTSEKKGLENMEYDLMSALELLESNNKLKFDPSVEVSIKLNIDKEKSDQFVRGMITFPTPVGKSKRIAAFVTPANEDEAKKAGADIVGGEELVKEILQKGKIDFEVAVAEPAAMKFMGRLGKVLGPKGLMPNPKDGTVTENVGKEIESLKKGKMTFKNDDGGNLHILVGKLSWGANKLSANIKAFVDTVKKLKPDSVRGEFLSKIVVSTSQGPGVRVKT